MDYIDAAKFGVKPSATGVQNQTAMAAAIQAAGDAGLNEIRLPPGRLKFNMHGLSALGSIVLNGNFTLRGAGRGKTTLKSDGFIEGTYHSTGGGHYAQDLANDNNHALIYVPAANGHDVKLLDMDLEGPDIGGLTFDLNICWGVWCGGGGSLRFERVGFYLWNQSVKCSPEYPSFPGIGTLLSAVDCYCGFRASGWLQNITGQDLNHDSVDLTNCVLEYDDKGSPLIAGQPTSNGEHPCIYVGTGTSIAAVHCWFKASGLGIGASATSYGWLHYGGSDKPRYARAIDCLFDVGLISGMYLNSQCQTQISGCTFRISRDGASGITMAGDALISNCQFVGETALKFKTKTGAFTRGLVVTGGTSGAHGVINSVTDKGSTGLFNLLNISGTFIDGEALTDSSTGAAAADGTQTIPYYGITDSLGHDAALECVNCTFGVQGQGSGWLYPLRRLVDGSQVWHLKGCEFNDIHPAGSQFGWNANAKGSLEDCVFQGTAGAHAFNVDYGTLIVSDCRFLSKPSIIGASTGAASLELYRNRWDVSAPLEVEGTNALTIRGAGNLFYSSGMGALAEGLSIVSSSGLSNITGDLTPRQGVGAYSYSGGILRFSMNGDAFEIDESGTPSITDIAPFGSSSGGVVADDHNRYHNARICLRAKQAFSLASSGNIIASAGTRPAGSMVTLQWFPAAGKWYELAAIGADVWHSVGGGGEPAFQNSWVNFGAPYTGLRFKKDALNFVHIEGTIKSGTNAMPVFTLPAGYRPVNAQFAPGVYGGLSTDVYVEVDANGDVIVATGSGNSSIGICLSFSID